MASSNDKLLWVCSSLLIVGMAVGAFKYLGVELFQADAVSTTTEKQSVAVRNEKAPEAIPNSELMKLSPSDAKPEPPESENPEDGLAKVKANPSADGDIEKAESNPSVDAPQPNRPSSTVRSFERRTNVNPSPRRIVRIGEILEAPNSRWDWIPVRIASGIRLSIGEELFCSVGQADFRHIVVRLSADQQIAGLRRLDNSTAFCTVGSTVYQRI